jgi:cell division protein FtsI/penicillin-binding protein 2
MKYVKDFTKYSPTKVLLNSKLISKMVEKEVVGITFYIPNGYLHSIQRGEQLTVFNLNKYKGGFHEQAYNRRKKPFGSLATRTLGDLYADTAKGAKNGLELSFDSILRVKTELLIARK